MSAYALRALTSHLPGAAAWEGDWLARVVDVLWIYPALYVSYLVFHRLVRVCAFNRLFSYTTFTHAPFWGRYKEPNARMRQLTHRHP